MVAVKRHGLRTSVTVESRPLIVQSDRTVLLETASPRFEEGRDLLARMAELVKSPEHFHTYRITPLSLWNAAASGLTADAMLDGLRALSRYDMPQSLEADIRDLTSRFGRLRLIPGEDGELVLSADEPVLLTQMLHQKTVAPLIGRVLAPDRAAVPARARGPLKQALIKAGYPAEDLVGYVTGELLDFRLRSLTPRRAPFALRPYQRQAVDAFHASGSPRGGSGVIVLPCGAGKTMVGMGVMDCVGAHTLILTTGITALRQWRDELLDKTHLAEDQIGEYSGEAKQLRPVTLTTYQILTYRRGREEEFCHFDLFNQRPWGLIIYDEVHLLPAPIFRVTAEIQATRRLGLTATLVREDGREDDVFSLIGPKKYDIPWKVLEGQGWIAEALCTEVRIPLPADRRLAYAVAEEREKFRLASTNPAKLEVLAALLRRHRDDHVLIIGQYLDQLGEIAERVGAPLVTGKTPSRDRERLYAAFRDGQLPVLVVSKVANFALDLPEANVAIQVSGTFGSRQEEAQRLGRILRPKADGGPARFYALVTRESKDQEFAQNRQLFLIEQGYRYRIENG